MAKKVTKQKDIKPPPSMGSPIGVPIGISGWGQTPQRRRFYQGQSDSWLFETNPALVRPQLYRSLQAMRSRIPVIATYVLLFNSFISKAKFSLKPVEDGDIAAAETAEKLLWSRLESSWSRMLVKMASYRLLGFSTCEWVAEQDENGLWGLTDIFHLPQWTITSMNMDKREKVESFNQQAFGVQEAMIPRAKTFYLVEDGTVDSPYGRGVLAECAETGLELLNLTELEQRGNLSNLHRKPNVLAPLAELAEKRQNGELTEDQYQRMIAPLMQFIQNPDSGPDINMMFESQTYPAYREGGAVESPSNQRVWDLIYPQPVPTDLSGQNPIERKTTEIARMLGIEALLLGNNSTGSFALAEVQADLFAAGIDGVLRDIANEATRVLKILWVANEGRLHPEAEQHLAEKEAADKEKEDAKAERMQALNNGGDDKPGGKSDALSKAIDDAEAQRVEPERPGRAEPVNGDWSSLAPTVEADLAAFIDAGQMVELVQNIAGLGLTINPDSNMVRDILDRAGLDADGAFQSMEEQHADKLEEMEARGMNDGPPGGGFPPKE